MMKKIIYIAFFILVGVSVKAQQLPHFTQYLINDYVINPAIGGSRGYHEIKSNHRYQWVGIPDAPRTYMLSYNAPTLSGKVGYGGYVFSDIVGPTRRTGFDLSYSYHLKITEKTKLSLAVFGGMLQFKMDGQRVNVREFNDLGVFSKIYPSAGFAFYYYGDKFFFGGAFPQLLPNSVKFLDPNSRLSKLITHAYISGGYKFNINDNYAIQPSVLLKFVSPVPIQADLSLRALYKDLIWIGGSFRPKEGISGVVGYNIQDNISIGYSYDYATSNLQNYSSGSHEIMLGLKVKRKQKPKF